MPLVSFGIRPMVVAGIESDVLIMLGCRKQEEGWEEEVELTPQCHFGRWA